MANYSRAGSRNSKFRAGYGRIPISRIAWLFTYTTGQIGLHAFDPEENDEEYPEIQLGSEKGLAYVLMITVPGRKKPVVWNFSGMTIEELQATRQFFDHLFDLAEPVVRQRDKDAHEAEAEGNTTYDRLYRSLPTLVIRERQERADRKSVHNRPQGSPERAGDNFDSGGGIRGVGDELADSESEQGVSQDDEQATD